MSTYTIDDLRQAWPERFQTRINGEEYIIIATEDLIHPDTVGCSNVESIERDFEWAEIQGHAYYRAVIAEVQDLIENLEAHDPHESWVDEVYHLLRGLEDYPLYDESDYSDLEHERIMEYMENTLAWDLCYEIDNRTDECEARIKHWISNNMDAVWECNDGSVDDQPINVTELAKDLPYWIGDLA